MQRLLIVGCGDIGLRTAALLLGRYRLFGLLHDASRAAVLRARGIIPIPGDLDRPDTLRRLAGMADIVLHFAPPRISPYVGRIAAGGVQGPELCDVRTAGLLANLAKGKSLPRCLIYISTSGVYGDCAGASVAETRAIAPITGRARRRADAERRLRKWGHDSGVVVSILRVPGIYAAERLPIARLQARTPALIAVDDVHSNHIHADDLARIVVAAIRYAKRGRIYNASDDSHLKMGDYFDLVADRFGLARSSRIPRAAAANELPPGLLSFMSESRRLCNARMKRELRVRLAYPTVVEGLAAIKTGLATSSL
ncbi:MAG: NAD-dependent epimerase/dehydratase family protein [Burkholderiales bacterium]|nr:NAD-dependent epimerase/dehydratase family protein [Burkholderiales bacterium]